MILNEYKQLNWIITVCTCYLKVIKPILQIKLKEKEALFFYVSIYIQLKSD